MFETSVSPPAPLNLDIEYQNADLWSLWGGANAPRAPPWLRACHPSITIIAIKVSCSPPPWAESHDWNLP